MLLSEHTELLRHLTLLRYLSPTDLAELAKHVERRVFAPRELIIQQGQPGDGLYMIYTGKVAVHVKLPGNYIAKIAELGVEQCFGEVFFLTGGLSTASVYAENSDQQQEVCCFFVPNYYLSILRLSSAARAYPLIRAIAEYMCGCAHAINNDIVMRLQQQQIYPELMAWQFRASQQARCDNVELTAKIFNAFKHIDLSKNLFPKDLEKLLSYMSICRASKGYQLYERDDVDAKFYIILSGAVQVMISSHQHLAKINIYGPGQLFGQNILVDGHPRTTSAVVREEAIIAFMSLAKWQQLQADDVELWYRCYDVLTQQAAKSLWYIDRQLIRLLSEAQMRYSP